VEPAAPAPEQPVVQAEAQKPGKVKIPGGKIVQNKVADRLQIFFDEKPAEAMCTNLKRNTKLWLLVGEGSSLPISGHNAASRRLRAKLHFPSARRSAQSDTRRSGSGLASCSFRGPTPGQLT
jgi:hypothetical protein